MTVGSKERLFHGQDYKKLRSRCLAEGRLFQDPEFPANDDSLGFDKTVQWMRPSELVEEPKFMVEGDRFSVVQGELGDCWFVSALSAITLNPALLRRVVPRDQSFTENYAGIFQFRFWQGGEWVSVVVDDRLPASYIGRLCFSCSANSDEFWSALLEKAYAKLHGSYGALNAGKCYEAQEDLTGGVTERFPLQDPPQNLYSIMTQASQRGSLITCNVPKLSGRSEDHQSSGLVSGHGYCVTGVRAVKVTSPWTTHANLVRLRNPWGDDKEWQGPWSDTSEEWGLVPEEVKKVLRVTVDQDGEFWMSFEEFKKNFEELFITSLNPHSLDTEARDDLYTLADVVRRAILNPERVRSRSGSLDLGMGVTANRKVWEEVNYDGSWVRNSTAGGSPRDMNLFSSNPQYLLHLTEEDDDPGEDGGCTVVLSLTQKHRRVHNLPLLTLALCVYQINEREDAPTPLTVKWLKSHKPLFLSKFKKTRTVTHRLSLRPGRYVIIPCTLNADQEAEFLLRVFCEKKATMEENDEEARLLEVPEEDCVDSGSSGSDSEGEIGATEVLKQVFQTHASQDGTANAAKLHLILNQIFTDEVEFSLDLTRSLLAMMDRDLSGNLDFYEFEPLAHSLRRWVDVYNAKREADSGYLCGHAWGLGDALRELGYIVPRRLQGLVVVRYGDQHGNIAITDFLMATCRISVMLERFQRHSGGREEQATVHLNDWMQDTLYC